MKINFTKKQYEALLELIYMGEWVANSHRLFEGKGKRIEKYDKLQEHIMSFAKEFHMENLVDIDNEGIYPSRELEEGRANELIDEYEEEVFWDELVDKMARRDFFRKYGAEKIRRMETMERIKKDHPFLEKYDKEVIKYGIDRLEIIGD